MDAFLRDLRYVTRALWRTPGFLVVAVLTLALGIGATTAIFSVVNGVLLRPLPYPDSERIVRMFEVAAKGGDMNLADPNFQDVRARSRSFAALAEVSGDMAVSVTGPREPARAHAVMVGPGFFDVLGVKAARGRLFRPDEEREGGAPVVVVSDAFWRRALAADPAALGAALTYDNHTFTVVGVLPPSADYPVGVDIVAPKAVGGFGTEARTAHNWRALGRLAPGVPLAQAQRELSGIAKQLKAQYGDDTWMADARVVPLREQLVGKVRELLFMLLGASGVLLLIACANVVNLLVARAAAREGELAVRLALGAGRGGLVRQFLAEALVLALGGGALGVVIATVGVRALLALEPGDLPRVHEVHVSLPVLGFAFAISLLAAVALGLLSAWRSVRGDVREAMAQAQRTQAGAGASARIRSTLVVAQMAMTVVLLVAAGLLGRSFARLLAVDPGFRPEHMVVMDVSLPWPDSPALEAQQVRAYDDMIARLRALPGVSEVGGVNALPLSGQSAGDGLFLIMSRPDEALKMEDMMQLAKDPARSGQAEFRVASEGYFRAMGIPLLRGRLFEPRDGADAPHVAVISASLAKAKWPNADPLGRIIQFGNMDGDLHPFTVVGVVGDVREEGLDAAPRPTFYATYRQRPRKASDFNFVVRGTGEPTATIAAARRVARELRPDVSPRLRTIESVVTTSVADRRFMLLLTGVFGGVALLLATLGVYSVISYLVTQRRQEIGVRVALGAQGADVLRLVLRQGVTLAVVGVAVGAVAALWVTRLLARFLFDVGTTDPVAFGGATALLVAVALLASFVPARRASKVDPMSVLRS